MLLFALNLPAPTARAQFNLFEVFVTATNPSLTPDLIVGGSSLPDLIRNLVNIQAEFASFAGEAISADITYAGVANAINITVDPVGMTATLTFTLLGPGAPTFVFTGADLDEQIEQFIQDNLATQITAFLQAVNTLSAVAVTDGSPISTTAQSAEYVFDRFGLHSDFTAWERRDSEYRHVATGLSARVDTYYSRIDTVNGNGQSVAIAPSFQYTFDEHIAFAVQIPMNYMTIEGADVFNLHVNLALPINLMLADEVVPLGVRITPFASMSGSASVDFVAGGILGGGGVLGTIFLDLGTFYASASAQISHHEGLTLTYGGFSLDPGVSQQIFKGGVKVTQTIGDSFFVYATCTFTAFLQDAAVDEYLTPGAGFGYRLPNGLNISAGYKSDLGNGFNTQQLRASIQLPF